MTFLALHKMGPASHTIIIFLFDKHSFSLHGYTHRAELLLQFILLVMVGRTPGEFVLIEQECYHNSTNMNHFHFTWLHCSYLQPHDRWQSRIAVRLMVFVLRLISRLMLFCSEKKTLTDKFKRTTLSRWITDSICSTRRRQRRRSTVAPEKLESFRC